MCTYSQLKKNNMMMIDSTQSIIFFIIEILFIIYIKICVPKNMCNPNPPPPPP